MAGFSLPNVDGLTSLEQVKNAVGIMTKELSWLMNNIDWKNVNELNIPLNGGGAVTIFDGGITVNNGVMDTFTVDIDGKVTMTSALIQSATGYPKVVMDPDTDLFGAYKSATEFIQMEAIDGLIAAPRLKLDSGIGSLSLYQQAASANMFAVNSKLNISAADDVSIYSSNPFKGVYISFEQLTDSSLGTSLFQQLLGKANKGISTSLSGSANGGIPIGTVLQKADGGTVTWNGIPSHSHAQN